MKDPLKYKLEEGTKLLLSTFCMLSTVKHFTHIISLNSIKKPVRRGI